MDFQKFKQAVIDAAEARGIEEYEIYYQSEASSSVTAFNAQADQFSSSVEGGVCFRCIANGKMGYAATEDLSNQQAVSIVEKALSNAAVLETEEEVFLNPGGLSYAPVRPELYPLPEAGQLIEQVVLAGQKLKATDPMVTDNCSVQGFVETVSVALCNSKGLDLSYQNNLFGMMVGAIVDNGKEKTNHYEIKLADPKTVDLDQLTAKAVAGAKEKLGAEPAPTGVCPVVFAPEAMADLLQVFSSAFSAEAAQKGLSPMAGKEGQQVASEAVTLLDDPFCKENPLPIHFDAEGSPTYCKAVIEKGQLKTLLYDLKTANQAGKKTTGNAAKANYSASVGIRPFTMYLQNGSLTEKQLLQKAGNGVYIDSLNGLHAGANSVSGDFSLQSAGFLIENGKKTKPVKAFTVAGNFFQVLQNITALADNMRLPMAMGMTAFGAPSTLVENLSVAGK